MIKVSATVQKPVPPVPPISFPFLYRSPEYNDRLYLRVTPRNDGTTRNSDVRLASEGNNPLGVTVLSTTFTDAEAWAQRLSEDEVVTLRNNFDTGPATYGRLMTMETGHKPPR